MKNKEPKWFIFDAEDKVLGRIATGISDALRGKKETDFANNIACGAKVVVINCAKVKVTGKKEEAKRYYHHSGFHGGIKTATLSDLRATHADRIIFNAVKGMLPKNKLQNLYLKNLYLYKDEKHPHTNIKFN